MDANLTYNPDVPANSHPLTYNEGVPTLDKRHDGTLATLVSTCGLVDPLARQHSSRPFPASHNRGSEDIDFKFTSPNIADSITTSGSMPFHSLFNSDHRLYFLDFDAKSLFSDPAYEIPPPLYRRLRLNDPQIVQTYRTVLHNQLTVHKVYEKLDQLKMHAEDSTWEPKHTSTYQQLDTIIMDSMIHAENQLGKSISKKFE